MQGQVNGGIEMMVQLPGIMNNQDPTPVPVQKQRWMKKFNTQRTADAGQFFVIMIIIAEYANHGGAEQTEFAQNLTLGDIPCVHYPIDPGLVEQGDDLPDIEQVIVGVADHAYPHTPTLPW